MARNTKRQPPPQTPQPRAAWAKRLRPACLFCAVALVVATPLVTSERPEITGVSLPFVMLWLALALVWFGGAIVLRVPLSRFGRIDGLMFALAGWFALSGLTMMFRGAPRPTVNAIWTWVGFAATLVMLRHLLRTPREVRALCAVMVAVAVCLSIAGIFQTFVIYPRDRAIYEQNPEAAMRQAGLSAAEGTAQRKHFEDRLYSNEPTATFSLTNSLAGFLAPWLIVLLGIALTLRWPSTAVESRGEKSSTALECHRTGRGLLLAALLGMVIISFCLLLTKSRTAWLATALGVVAVVSIPLRRLRVGRAAMFVVCGALLSVVIFAVLSLTGILEVEILTQALQSLRYRFEYWQSTLAMIADHPLLGCGPGNFQQYYTAYKLPQASETVADPHNFLFELAAVAGLPALLLLLLLLALTLKGSGVFFSRVRDEAAKDTHEKKTPDPFSVRLLYAAGAAGIVLAFTLGVVTGYLTLIEPVLLGALAAGVTIWLLDSWVQRGELPQWLLLTAMAVLCVNLLAAGGIGFPGVAITLWVLIAACTVGELSPSSPRPSRPPAVAAAIIAAALLAAAYFSTYRPVLLRSGHLASAAEYQAAGRSDHALAEMDAAAAADPLAAQPKMQLAQLYFHRWLDEPEPTTDDPDYQQFQQHAQSALELDQRSADARSSIAYWYLRAYDRIGSPECLAAAVDLFREAVELYPHDAMTNAQLAWAAQFAPGQTDVNPQQHAQRALEIDDVTPHNERKLGNRRLLVEIGTASPNDPLVAAAGSKSAEQWMREIRNNQDPQ